MKIKVGSDFSGVGAFEQALKRLGIDFETVFACDMDKYARKTYIANYGETAYYPENVYDREIPAESLDIYMTSPPCQAFSIAGKRLGKDDERGILFFNSHEFIRVNKPRFFIFENVKGLLSDDKTSKDDIYGRTFREWINYLGGKSVNGVPVLFPLDEAVPYHIYHTVINAKDHNIPQNRERVFIVGIRDDADNVFSWPQEQPLTKRLRDVLEENVDPKYYLSEKAIEYLIRADKERDRLNINLDDGNGVSSTITSNYRKGVHNQGETYISMLSDSKKSREREFLDISQPLRANTGAGHNDYVVKVKSDICIADLPDKLRFHRNDARKSGVQGMDAVKGHGIADAITVAHSGNYHNGITIRRLTPIECFRLMGFPDTLVQNARAAGISDSQLYKQAGNSIVVDVLAAIINGIKPLRLSGDKFK